MVVELTSHRKTSVPESDTLVCDPAITVLVMTFRKHPYRVDVRNKIKVVVTVQEIVFFVAHDADKLYGFRER